MGWDFEKGATKRKIVASLIADGHRHKTIAYHLDKNTLYVVHEIAPGFERPKPLRIICTYMLSSEPHYGWGSKAIDECAEPADVACPLDFLALAPKVFSPRWRERVRQYWQARAQAQEESTTS